MEVRQIAAGLWRWTAPHPAWTPAKGGPGGWEREVASVYWEPPDDDVVVLVDPLVPEDDTEDGRRFWAALDADLARGGRRVVVIVCNRHHGRSARRIEERYLTTRSVEILAHAGAAEAQQGGVTRAFGTSGPRIPGADDAWIPLSGGTEAYPVDGYEPGEVVLYIPARRALVTADAIIGCGAGAVAVAPESWGEESDAGRERYRSFFRPSLRGVLDRPLDLLLPSHGEPVLAGGGLALARALAAPAWGS